MRYKELGNKINKISFWEKSKINTQWFKADI